jgi:hypothetical protein
LQEKSPNLNKRKAVPRPLPTHDKTPESSKSKSENRSKKKRKSPRSIQKALEEEGSEDEEAVVYAEESDNDEGAIIVESPGKIDAKEKRRITNEAKKKRRIIIEEELENEEDKEEGVDDDSLVSFIDTTLVKPKPKVPLFEQELVLEDEYRPIRKPTFYKPIQKSPTKSRKPLKKKKYEIVPNMKDDDFKKLMPHQIEKTSEVFPRWVAPPEVFGTRYSEFFEPRRASEFSLEEVPPHQQELSLARKMCNNNMSRPVNMKGL